MKTVDFSPIKKCTTKLLTGLTSQIILTSIISIPPHSVAGLKESWTQTPCHLTQDAGVQCDENL